MPAPLLLPLIPLRDTVVFPCLTVPLLIGRSRSLAALKAVLATDDQLVILAAQKDSDCEDPLAKQIYRVGTLAKIHQVMRLPDESVKILVEGQERVAITRFRRRQPGFQVEAEPIETVGLAEEGERRDRLEVMQRMLVDEFAKYVSAHPKLPDAAYESVQEIVDPTRLTDLIASFLPIDLEAKQQLLAEANVSPRLMQVSQLLHGQMQLMEIEQEIHARVRERIDANQKEYYLREQLKVIQSELGDETDEMVSLRRKLETIGIPTESWPRVERELKRLEQLPPMTAEAGTIQNYLEWLAALPWQQMGSETLDLLRAERVLNADHYGQEKVKERILEFLAVRQLLADRDRSRSGGPAILCLVGPPGVGKTSLARSIANSLDRKLVRVSLGGVHDESAIRGHRRTYIGSMPGRILQALRDVGTRNPVMLLDEIDKLSTSFQGDPAAALLEVLDPEQNASFSDHFVEIPFDLSQVFFICTANTDDTIPAPLLDRMDVVRLGGYTVAEKMAIARQHLIPKQIERNGLEKDTLELQTSALQRLICEYTREAGVRNLERKVGALCRKVARKSLTASDKRRRITERNLESYLGTPPFLPEEKDLQNQVGICTGLAWTPYGGCTLPIEVNVMPGKGKLQLTGQLGDVMKESAQAAFSFIRSHRKELQVTDGFPDQIDVHIHIPEGATPKDGPSAGIAMATALVSALSGRAVRHDVAMTGEITLRGRILPIGGLKEKSLAAKQVGIRTVLFPKGNTKDLQSVPDEVTRNLELRPVEYLAEVLDCALEERSAGEKRTFVLPWVKVGGAAALGDGPTLNPS
ncbi:endopeptidase La [Synechococcus sp. PCC 7336]|uniref:endopeptidase La n=1 Tax=Synechococcus sp. PCC 7336 TaxID=195250 RepID=UPI00034566D0|nr:endopeptidase La [Synechococcus sp. PCC 7336]